MENQDGCTSCVLQIDANNLLFICNDGWGYVSYFPRYSPKTASKMGPSHWRANMSLKWPWSFSHFSDIIFAYWTMSCTHTSISRVGLNLFLLPANQSCPRSIRVNAKLRLISPSDGIGAACCHWTFRQWQKEKKRGGGGRRQRKDWEKRNCTSYLLHDSSDHFILKNNPTCYKKCTVPCEMRRSVCASDGPESGSRFLDWLKGFLFSRSA